MTDPKLRAALLVVLRKRQRRRAQAALEEKQAMRRRKRLRIKLAALVAALEAQETRCARRKINRGTDGWAGSTINDYVTTGDVHTYKLNFRVTRETFCMMSNKLSSAGYLCTNACRDPGKRITSQFKLGVCLYFMAGHGKGDMKAVADAASIGRSTMLKYLDEFCMGVFRVLKPVYMSSKPPSASMLSSVRSEFAARRGIANVAMATDGTHIPFHPQNAATASDYKNYKGWSSILMVAFVNAFYLFVDADVGAAGKSGDNSVLTGSWLLEQIRKDPEVWLGPDGVIAADGGASDGGKLLLNPIPNATQVDDLWYNFCHSSTRFFVEEVFGRWKNRFRFLLQACDLDHSRFTNIIYASLVLHNVCTIHKDNAVDFSSGGDEDWNNFFKQYARDMCPQCVRRNAMHCSHSAKNRMAYPISAANGTKDLRFALRDQLWKKLEDDTSNAADVARAEMHARAAKGGVGN